MFYTKTFLKDFAEIVLKFIYKRSYSEQGAV